MLIFNSYILILSSERNFGTNLGQCSSLKPGPWLCRAVHNQLHAGKGLKVHVECLVQPTELHQKTLKKFFSCLRRMGSKVPESVETFKLVNRVPQDCCVHSPTAKQFLYLQ